MSKHDLKGVDTSKVGNNKYVDYTFKDYMDDFGLNRKGAEKKLKSENIFLRDLNPIAPETKPFKDKTILERADQLLMGFGGPAEVVGGKVVGKNRPTGLHRFTTGIMPYELLGFTDFDQRGTLFGKHSKSGFGGRPDNYELPKDFKDLLRQRDKDKEEASIDPLDNIDKIVDAELRYKKEADRISRKGRIADNAIELANMQAQIPLYEALAKRTSTFKQQQLLDAELIKQSMPDAREARKLSSASRMAGELGAVANAYGTAGAVAQGGIRQPTATFSV